MTAPADREGGFCHFVIRGEASGDEAAIDLVTQAAFLNHPFSRQTEHRIVHGLRQAGALQLSLVATINSDVVGHIAFSGVTIGGVDIGWWGLVLSSAKFASKFQQTVLANIRSNSLIQNVFSRPPPSGAIVASSRPRRLSIP